MKRVKAAAALLMSGVMLMTSGCVQKVIDLATGGNKEYDAYVCTTTDTDYKNPLYEFN